MPEMEPCGDRLTGAPEGVGEGVICLLVEVEASAGAVVTDLDIFDCRDDDLLDSPVVDKVDANIEGLCSGLFF